MSLDTIDVPPGKGNFSTSGANRIALELKVEPPGPPRRVHLATEYSGTPALVVELDGETAELLTSIPFGLYDELDAEIRAVLAGLFDARATRFRSAAEALTAPTPTVDAAAGDRPASPPESVGAPPAADKGFDMLDGPPADDLPAEPGDRPLSPPTPPDEEDAEDEIEPVPDPWQDRCRHRHPWRDGVICTLPPGHPRPHGAWGDLNDQDRAVDVSGLVSEIGAAADAGAGFDADGDLDSDLPDGPEGDDDPDDLTADGGSKVAGADDAEGAGPDDDAEARDLGDTSGPGQPSRAQVIECIANLARPTFAQIAAELWPDHRSKFTRTQGVGMALSQTIDDLEHDGAIERAGNYKGGPVYRLRQEVGRADGTDPAPDSAVLLYLRNTGPASIHDLALHFDNEHAIVAGEISVLERHQPPLVVKRPGGKYAAVTAPA